MKDETQLAALQAVADGKVRHVYRGKDNVYKCEAMTSTTFHILAREGFIKDGQGYARGYLTWEAMVDITDTGRDKLVALYTARST